MEIKEIMETLGLPVIDEEIEEKDYDKILMQAHTLKRVGANLGFDKLSQECAGIVTAVREKRYEEISPYFEQAKKEYETVMACIRQIQG